MEKVRKAIIPAAGLGTRFLPATKAQPKEMLPIVDKPAIQYVIEEAAAAGIEDVIVVTGRGKRAIEDHFDKAYELEEILKMQGKMELVKELSELTELVNIHYIRQKEARGLGHAIYCARKFIGNEPFAVLLGDDIVVSEVPCLKQLMDIFQRYHSSVIAVQEVAEEEVSRYGIIGPGSEIEQGLFNITTLLEKPATNKAPSRLAIMGRYVLRPEIFNILENLPPGAGGEIQLTDGLRVLNRSQAILGYTFQGKRYDVGDKLGFLKANVEFALKRKELKGDFMDFLQSLAERQYQL